MTKGNTTSEEVFGNSDLAKIQKWVKGNKIQLNETKPKTMLISKKRNNENINICLNNKDWKW